LGEGLLKETPSENTPGECFDGIVALRKVYLKGTFMAKCSEMPLLLWSKDTFGANLGLHVSECAALKRIVYLKIQILSSFAHPHVIPKQYFG